MGAISALPSHLAFQYSRCSISCPELKFVFVFPDTERKETTITYLTMMKLKLNLKPELSLWVTMYKKKIIIFFFFKKKANWKSSKH